MHSISPNLGGIPVVDAGLLSQSHVLQRCFENDGGLTKKMVVSWDLTMKNGGFMDLTMKNGGFMGFNHEKLWFHGGLTKI